MLFIFHNTDKMNKELKTYELLINEQSEAFVDAVALTHNPAIDSLFLAFNKDNIVELPFSIDEDKIELLGAAMIPDIEIERKPNEIVNEPHIVKFSAEQIKEAALIFMKKGFQKNLNIEHSSTDAKAFIFQSFIINSELNINSPKGLYLPNGSWVIGVKCEDKEVFEAVKKVGAGFSVQGMFQYKFQSEVSDDDKLTQTLLSELNTILKKIK